MSESLGESSHSRASESPALYPARASSDRNKTPTDDVRTPTGAISPIQFCSSAAIFCPQIEQVFRNETDLPEPIATPLTLVTLPEDLPPPIQHRHLGRAPKTSIPTKPVKEIRMGNIFGSKKKKKKNVHKDEDEEIWKKMDAKESSASSQRDRKKKNKKKKDKKSKRVESPSPSRGAEGSLKGKDPKRYAMYEPHISPKEIQTYKVRSRTLPARIDPSEFRKSIGDPMDFRMADDVSSAGSPGQATPETTTPPVQKSPVPIYKKIQLNRDKNSDKSLPNTPKSNRKYSAAKPGDSSINDKVSDVTDNRKPHLTPTPGTGSPRPRGYILPSPPSRPKFYATEPGSASPRLLRVKPQKPLMLDINGDDVLHARTKPYAPQPKQKKTGPDTDLPVSFVTSSEGACLRSKRDDNKPCQDSADIAMQKENEENERNLKREERRRLATVTDINTAPKLEECGKIQETVVESIEAHVTDLEKHEVTSGPKLAVLSTIPPPEKAVLSHVPPPSPSAMDALCEENEEEEEDDSDNHVTMRRSKDVEEFGGIVCQRLSQLLESQDDGTLRLQFVESSGPSSSLSPASPCMLMSGGSDVDKERMEDAGLRFSSLSPPMETENVYKEKAISQDMLCVEMTKPSTFSQRLERSSISTRSTQGSNSASDLDGRIDAIDFKPRSRDFTRDRPDNESDISSSDEEESSYTSDSEYSSNGYEERRGRDQRENEYSIPWDLHQFPRTGSYTSDGVGMSDDQLCDESESRHTQSVHAQRISRHGLKRGEKVISDCDEISDNKWDGYPHSKYQRNDGNLHRNRQVSVEELHIEPISVKRQLFQLPRKFSGNEIDHEIVEDEIRPAYIGSSEHTPSLIPKRGSEMLSDVIDAYTAEELAAMQRKQPMVPPKRQSTLSEDIIIEPPSNPSALDKSLQKIFTQNEEIEEKYPELAPLHSLILDVEEGGAPSVEPFFDFRPGQLPTFTRVPFGSRRSLAYSESDLDMSEQRDDVSSDNMDADDEDDDEGGMMRLEGKEAGDAEVVFGRTYTEHDNIVDIKRTKVILEQEASEGEDSVFSS